MKLYVFLATIAVIVGFGLGWRSFKIIFTELPYEINKEFLEIRIEIQNNTGETAINCHMNLIEDMDDLKYSYAINLEQSDGNYTTLVSKSGNFCKFLKNRSTDQVLKVIYEDMAKYGTIFKSCPLKKGIYFFHDFRVDEEMLPSYIPETNFIVEIMWAMPNKSPPLFKGKLHGKVDKEKGFNNLKLFSLG